MGKWMTMPLAALVLGSVAAALPAAAAQSETGPGTAARTAAAAAPRDGQLRAKADRPLVMLVCRERRGERRTSGARSELACSTRWAGI